MLPQLVALGPWRVNSYTALLALAALLGLLAARWLLHLPWRAVIDAQLCFALAAVLGGRLLFVVLNRSYFAQHPGEVMDLSRTPGLSAQGALIGTLLLASVWRNRRVLPAIALMTCLAGVAAAVGCIPNGCGHGREVFWTDGVWWQLRVDWPDAYLIRNPRLPAQAFAAGWAALCLFAAAWMARKHAQRPQLGLAFAVIGALSAGDFCAAFARADVQPTVAQLRVEQWLDVAILCASLPAALLRRRTHATHARASVPDRNAQA
jgi:prolipoprotein diacylglyceryltransferase